MMAGNEGSDRAKRNQQHKSSSGGKDDFAVRLVKVFGHPETQNLMNEAFKCLQDEGLQPEYVSEDQCFSVTHGSRNQIYIFDIFEGEAYTHIVSLGCRVFGPMCIVTCLECKKEIPKRSKPVYNLAMKDIIVCCSVVAERDPIYEAVEMMGGSTTRKFSEDVTHLVAGEVGSQKYLVAAGSGKQIMVPEWVHEVWRKSKLEAVHGLDEQFQKYKCPIFLGRVITSSGLAPEDKQFVKRQVEKEGGKYTGEMKIKENTHLIINEAKGQKYQFALQWKLAIVKLEWLYDSIEKGFCQDESLYTVEEAPDDRKGKMKTSTPERRSAASHIGDISNISMISMVNINETVASMTTNLTSTTHMEDPDYAESVDVTKKPAELFLDGCKIYLSGLRGTTLEKLRKIINNGGGTRFNQISDDLTHVVVGERISEDVEQIRALHSRPHVVTPKWLVDCYKSEAILDETQYASLELPPPTTATPPTKGARKKSRLGIPNVEKPSGSRKSLVQPATAGQDDAGDDMNDILSQYLDNGADADRTTSNDTTVAPPVADEDMTQDPNNTTAMETEGGAFYGKFFVFYGFGEEHIPELSSYIKENGGNVLNMKARQIPDYAIVPIDGFPVDRTVKDIVTNVWLQSCIEQNVLLDVGSNPLFTPIEIQMDKLPLEGCVLSVSGYVGSERDCYMHIADVLGARCQEYFVRNAKNGYQPSTHLIVNAPEGSKYLAARKWKIPALSTAWLLASAKSGKKEPEENYLIENIHAEKHVNSDGALQTKPADVQSNTVEQKNKQKRKPDENVIQSNLRTHQAELDLDNELEDRSDKNLNQSNLRTHQAELDNRLEDRSDKSLNQSNLRTNTAAENEDCVSKDLNELQLEDGSKSKTNITADKQSADNNEQEKHPDFSTTGSADAFLLQINTQGEQQNEECDNENDDKMEDAADDVAEGGNRNIISSSHNNASESAQSDIRTDTGKYQTKKTVFLNNANADPSETPPLTRYIRKMENRPATSASPEITTGIFERLKNKTPKRYDWRAVEREQNALAKKQKTFEQKTSPSQKENLVEMSTPIQSRVKELKKQEGNVVDKDTPSKFLNPNVRYHPKFDTEELMKSWVTPEDVRVARAKRKNSMDLDELFEMKFAEAEQNLKRAKERKLQEKQMSQSQEDGYTECYSEPSTVLQGVVIAVGKKLVKDQSEFNEIVASLGGDYRWNYNSDCTHFIFQGRQNDTAKDFKLAKSHELKIVSPHWLYMCKEQNARVEESLFPHTFNPNLSLSVVSTRRTPMRTPLRSSRRNMRDKLSGKPEQITQPPVEPVVIPDEDEVKRKHDVLMSPEKVSCEEDNQVPDNGEQAVEETGGSLEMREVLSRQLENVMAESKGKKRRKSKRLNCSGNMSTPEENTSARQTRILQENAQKNTSSRNSRSLSTEKSEDKNTGEMAPSQSVHVVWDDPMGRMEQEMLAHKLERANSPTQEVGMLDFDPVDAQYSDTDDEAPVPQFVDQHNVEEMSSTPKVPRQTSDKTPTPEGPSIAFPTNSKVAKVTPPKAVLTDETQKPVLPSPTFILSGMSQPEKDDYGALIEQLGGKLLDAQQFNSKCTHLVISNVTRNEKFLASIAAGKWVLHKSYFEACRSEQCFVQEDFYEWGSEGTLSLVKNMDTNVRLLAIAARDWRIKIQEEKKTSDTKYGAFCSWRVILCCDKNREGNYRRLLEAGGATVLNQKPPFTGSVDATHALLDLNRISLAQDDLENLVLSDCLCLKPEYISAHLSNPEVNVTNYYPPEIEALKAVLSESNERTRKRRNTSSSGSEASLKRSKRR